MNLIKRELNPKYDLSRHTAEFSTKEYYRLAVNVWKSLIRGGVVGASVGGAAGAITGYVSGGDVAQKTLDGMIIGGGLGLIIDEIQYMTRYSIYRRKCGMHIQY